MASSALKAKWESPGADLSARDAMLQAIKREIDLLSAPAVPVWLHEGELAGLFREDMDPIPPGVLETPEPKSHYAKMNSQEKSKIRPFDFFGLAQELRDQIYDLLIDTPPKYPQLKKIMKDFFELEYNISPSLGRYITLSESQDNIFGIEFVQPVRHFALFRICRQVYEEAKLRLYGASTFRTCGIKYDVNFATNSMTAHTITPLFPLHFNAANLHKLRLDFMTTHGDGISDFSLLSQMPLLRNLEVGFMSYIRRRLAFPELPPRFREQVRQELQNSPLLDGLLLHLIRALPKNVDLQWVESVWISGFRPLQVMPVPRELLEELAEPLMVLKGTAVAKIVGGSKSCRATTRLSILEKWDQTSFLGRFKACKRSWW